jgi:hypothetical protein
MTKDDIIRMACKAGFSDTWLALNAGPSNCELPAAILARFASLVADAEREACAVMVENYALQYAEPVWAVKFVNAVRARGQS